MSEVVVVAILVVDGEGVSDPADAAGKALEEIATRTDRVLCVTMRSAAWVEENGS